MSYGCAAKLKLKLKTGQHFTAQNYSNVNACSSSFRPTTGQPNTVYDDLKYKYNLKETIFSQAQSNTLNLMFLDMH
jgi:hypothetical protein